MFSFFSFSLSSLFFFFFNNRRTQQKVTFQKKRTHSIWERLQLVPPVRTTEKCNETRKKRNRRKNLLFLESLVFVVFVFVAVGVGFFVSLPLPPPLPLSSARLASSYPAKFIAPRGATHTARGAAPRQRASTPSLRRIEVRAVFFFSEGEGDERKRESEEARRRRRKNE